MTSSQPSLGDKPSRMPPADLGSAFGGKSRSDGLGGRLAPMRIAPPPQDPEPAPTTDAPPAQPKPTKASTPRSAKTPPAATARNDRLAPAERNAPASSGQQTIVVYVSASIRERLRTAAGDQTFTDIVLAALDTTLAKLQSRFAQPAATNSLFAGRGRPTFRRHSEPHVQVSLRPLRDDLAVIDQLGEDLNAPSRSALINAALDEFLP